MYGDASKAAILSIMSRTIPRAVAWSVYAPNTVDGDFGTTTAPSLVSALYVRFKRLNVVDRGEAYVLEKRPMYQVTAVGFTFVVDQIIRDPDFAGAGIFKVVESVPPPDSSIPTASYALVVRTN